MKEVINQYVHFLYGVGAIIIVQMCILLYWKSKGLTRKQMGTRKALVTVVGGAVLIAWVYFALVWK